MASEDVANKVGSGMNNPDHISESLETIFWLDILKFSDPGSFRPWNWILDRKNRIRDPEQTSRIRNTGSDFRKSPFL